MNAIVEIDEAGRIAIPKPMQHKSSGRERHIHKYGKMPVCARLWTSRTLNTAV